MSMFQGPLWEALPFHCRDGLEEYVKVGCPVGAFLEALLSNDLRRTYEKADDINSHHVRDYIMWLYNEAPAPCWGSPAKFKAWLALGGLAGMNSQATREKSDEKTKAE